MATRLIAAADVERLLPMGECIEVMASAFETLARGRTQQPLRTVLRLPHERGAFAVMPAQLDAPDAFGLKVISVMPSNEGTRWDSHQGAVLLFEPQHGTLIAIMDASSVTGIRTAAVSALATRLLARPDAGDLALLGSGVQARTHLAAMGAVRPLRRVRVWSRSARNARAFAQWAAPHVTCPVSPAASAREAVADADLICTVTSSREPVLCGEWIAPGAHLNAVGASLPEARELDTAAVARARLYVDRRESAQSEAGDFLIPLREGAIPLDHIVAELGEVVAGLVPGRRSGDEVTLFKSLGLAIEDVAAAHHVHEAAVREDVGLRVRLGGERAVDGD